MNKKERLILIEQYRKGRLDGLKLKRFEKLLETDEVLRRELALDTEMSEALDESSDYNLFQKLVQEAETEYFKKDRKSALPGWWRSAAALLLVGVVSIIIWQNNRERTPAEIFAQGFEPYQAPSNFRSDQLSEMDEEFMLGLIKYEDQNYQESIRLFNKAIAKDSVNHTARFLLGISHMALQQFDSAEPIFKEMMNDSSHLFTDQVRWYLGLLYLSDGDTENDSLTNDAWNEITDKDYLKKTRKWLY